MNVYSACPNNSYNEIKTYVNYICKNNGGNGCIREFIDYLYNKNLISDPNNTN